LWIYLSWKEIATAGSLLENLEIFSCYEKAQFSNLEIHTFEGPGFEAFFLSSKKI